MMDAGYASERTRVRRQPRRGRYDANAVYEVLDAGLVAHVAFVEGQQPFCIPMLQARIGDVVYIHGSIASRAVRVLGSGCQACLTVTVLDGIVLARSAFEHSANYRAAVVLGRFRPVEDATEKVRALAAFTDKMIPGRWEEVRQPSAKELKATAILALLPFAMQRRYRIVTRAVSRIGTLLAPPDRASLLVPSLKQISATSTRGEDNESSHPVEIRRSRCSSDCSRCSCTVTLVRTVAFEYFEGGNQGGWLRAGIAALDGAAPDHGGARLDAA